MKQDIALIERLSACFGPTSCEGEVADAVLDELSGVSAEIAKDAMGNVTVHVAGPVGAPRIMLCAHMDEVGFMITEIDEDGFLRFDNLGGIDPRVLCGRGVLLGDETKRVRGIIAAKGIHLQSAEERKKAPVADDLYIDIGAANGEEAKALISLGDFGTFDTEFSTFGKENAFMRGKALDDRMGCALLIEVLREVVKNPPAIDLWFCFTIREEIGRSGAKVVANRIAPDAAIILETTAVADLPGVEPRCRVASVGGGGVLSLVDRSTVYDRALVDFAISVAKKNNIPFQIKQYVSGGNDAAHVQRSGVGVSCMALSAATRYLHAPVSVASVLDYRSMREWVLSMLLNWKEEG